MKYKKYFLVFFESSANLWTSGIAENLTIHAIEGDNPLIRQPLSFKAQNQYAAISRFDI